MRCFSPATLPRNSGTAGQGFGSGSHLKWSVGNTTNFHVQKHKDAKNTTTQLGGWREGAKPLTPQLPQGNRTNFNLGLSNSTTTATRNFVQTGLGGQKEAKLTRYFTQVQEKRCAREKPLAEQCKGKRGDETHAAVTVHV